MNDEWIGSREEVKGFSLSQKRLVRERCILPGRKDLQLLFFIKNILRPLFPQMPISRLSAVGIISPDHTNDSGTS